MMESLQYKLNASVTPPSGSGGDTVRIAAQLTDVVGEVKNVYVSVPQYGLSEILRPQGEGNYALTYTIPWGGYPGTCELQIYAADSAYRRGPVAKLQFQLR